MLRQFIRARKPIVAHAQTRSLHSPFVVLSGSKPCLASESQSKTTASAATYEYSESKPDTYSSYEAGTTAVEEKNAFEDEASSPRVHVVSEPDPNLGAPFGVRLGAYPVSEPFA